VAKHNRNGCNVVSLNRAYEVFRKDGFWHSIAYFLAIPTLLFLNLLRCGNEPFNPQQYVVYYRNGNLPADLLPYNEYLQTLKFIADAEVEVRDAEFV
jgi:hypothetical protein